MEEKTKDSWKKKLTANGAPLLAIILFFAAFAITVLVVGALNKNSVDRRELGEAVRAIVDSEDGEIAAVINGTEYYEKDIQLVIQSFRLSQPQFLKLNDEQLRALAGDSLIEQKMLIQEFDRLGLVVTQDELDEYIASEKKTASDMISSGSKEGDDFLEYVQGYGCTFTEYWTDSYVVKSMEEAIKTERVKDKICEMKGISKQTVSVIEKYLTGLLEDGTYEITLFGEKYPKENSK